MFLRRRLGGAVGVFWCSLRQGAPGFISTLGASWAAGHRTWLFRKERISTGSGAMKDSVLSAWFFKEEIRAKFPWGRVRIHASLLKALQTTKTGWSSRHTPEILIHHKKSKWKIKAFLLLTDCPSWPSQEGHRSTRIKVVDRRVNCVEGQQSPFLHSLNIYQAQSEVKWCSVTATEAESWQDREGTLGTSELLWLVSLFYFFWRAMCAHFKAEKARKAMKGQGSCPSQKLSSLFLPLQQPLAPASALLGFFSSVALILGDTCNFKTLYLRKAQHTDFRDSVLSL